MLRARRRIAVGRSGRASWRRSFFQVKTGEEMKARRTFQKDVMYEGRKRQELAYWT